jgi:DNA-binding CsgD family transcriptional regulator
MPYHAVSRHVVKATGAETLLNGLGLTSDEETVYVALLDLPVGTLADLRARCPGARVRVALASLERTGLVSRLEGSPVRYTAAPPDVGLELLARSQEQGLARARLAVDPLTARYRRARATHEVIEVVTGREETGRRWELLQRSARVEVRCFDRPPYVASSSLSNPVEEEMLAAGVAYRCVYHPAGFELPGRPAGIRKVVAAGEQARVTENVPVKMFIADDRLGLLPLEVAGGTEASLIIHASSMLDTLIALFELVWARAIPLHADADLPSLEPGPSEEEANLLGLLAAGLTDAAIARHLGTHPRTVQRRVRDLLDRLDAGTRFQAGLQAVRRGWL